MLLNKKDTSIVTLTLLLSIATSPVAWAASRWPSNASEATSTTLPESSLLVSKRVRSINIDQQDLNAHNEWDFKLKSMSQSETVLSSPSHTLLSQLDSPVSQPNTNNNNVVGQSSQVQQATVSATEGEIPTWLWWFLPMIPILGVWIGLQLKAQRSKSENKPANDSITPKLSTPSDVPTSQPQTVSSPVLVGAMELNAPTESLKTPSSSIVSSVSVPRTVLTKHHPSGKEWVSIEDEEIQPVAEAVLIDEIDETEAEAVIAEFLTTKTTEPELSAIETIETEPDISSESVILESNIDNKSQTITHFESYIEPELSIIETIEAEPDISSESVVEDESSSIPEAENSIESELPAIETVETPVENSIESELPAIETVETPVENSIESELPAIETVETQAENSIESQLPAIETQGEDIELGVAHQDVRSETDVAAIKFNLGRDIKFEPSLADVDQGLPALPDGYGQSQIFLLPRDPNWAYAYWDIPNEHKEHLRQQGGKYLLLRIYDVTGIDLDTHPPLSIQEYECDEMTREWYLSIPMSDRDYICELGYLTIDGRWLVLVRSNHIRIPPIYPSDWENDQFIHVPWTEDLRGKIRFRL